jgi:hypothetical protein
MADFQVTTEETSNGRKQARNHPGDEAMRITQSRLTKEVSQEATSDEGQDGYCGWKCGMEIVLFRPVAVVFPLMNETTTPRKRNPYPSK